MNINEYNNYMESLELHAKYNLLQNIKQFLYDNREQLCQYLDKKEKATNYCSQLNKDALKYVIFPKYKLTKTKN